MKTISKIAALTLVAALFLNSCKNNGEEGPTSSKAKLLTAATWIKKSYEWKTTSGSWVSSGIWASSEFPATVTFFDTNTFVTSAGGSGTWQFSSDEQRLTMVNSRGTSYTTDIAAISATTMQLSLPLDTAAHYTIAGSGSNLTYTYYNAERTTFTH